MTTIVLADDHHIVRQGLRALLSAESDLRLVGEAEDGLETVRLVESLKPDVLIVDLMLPNLNGLEVTRQVHQRHSRTRVIILSVYTNEGYVLQALRNGAAGYVAKGSHVANIVQAVREVVAGRRYLSPPLSERAIEAYTQNAEPTELDIYQILTTREREVLQLAAEGYSNTEIAAQLFISPRTIEIHRANLMRKLGLHSQTDLIRFALRQGILPMED